MAESKVKLSAVFIGSIAVETEKLKTVAGFEIFQVTDRKSCEEIVKQIADEDVIFIIADGREVYYAEKFFSDLPALKIYLVTEAQAADNKNLSDAIIQLPAQNFGQKVYEIVRAFDDFSNIDGLVEFNFADVNKIFKNSGKAVATIGEGTTVEEAVNDALASHEIKSARAIFMNVKAAQESVSMPVLHAAVEKVKAAAHEDAEILWGVTVDENFVDKVKIALVAGKCGEK